MKNKILKYSIVVVGILMAILAIDYLRTSIFKTEPLIVISTKNDNGVKISNSILYKTYNCDGRIYIESRNSKFTCPVIEKGITITQNNKDVCIDGIDYFYEDENYRYYFECYKSNYITIKKDNTEYPLKQALNNNIITIKDLEGKLYFNKEDKKESKEERAIKLIKGNKCNTKTEKIYTYNKIEYYYDCSNNTYTLNINNEIVSLNKALQSGLITINKLKELGLNIIENEIKDIKKDEIEIKDSNKVTIEKNDNIKIDNTNKDTTETIKNSPELVTIKNNNKNQSQVIIYKDNSYEYYYYTPNNADYSIKYNNKYYTIKDAIDKNIITLSSLQGLGLEYFKKSLNKIDIKEDEEKETNDRIIKLVDKSNGANCAQAIEYFYEDNNYKYYFTCKKSQYMYLIIDGKEYLLTSALKNKITTIKELEDNGIRFPKQSKNLVTK